MMGIIGLIGLLGFSAGAAALIYVIWSVVRNIWYRSPR